MYMYYIYIFVTKNKRVTKIIFRPYNDSQIVKVLFYHKKNSIMLKKGLKISMGVDDLKCDLLKNY